MLLDYGDIVIHVQRDAERDFYGLDRLYADCPVYEVEGVPPYERDVAFGDLAQQGDSASVRGAERIEDLPLAGEGPASGDDEF